MLVSIKGDISMDEKIVTVLNEMSEYLSIAQMKKLQEVIISTFAENEVAKKDIPNDEFLEMFLAAKQIEGCSERTINYYRVTVEHLLSQTDIKLQKQFVEMKEQVDKSKVIDTNIIPRGGFYNGNEFCISK